jgi:hypothetical protein
MWALALWCFKLLAWSCAESAIMGGLPRRRLVPRPKRDARERRRRVLKHAKSFPGIRGTFNSGSIAHGTANSDLDADCGVILDRRTYPDLGPDGDEVLAWSSDRGLRLRF